MPDPSVLVGEQPVAEVKGRPRGRGSVIARYASTTPLVVMGSGQPSVVGLAGELQNLSASRSGGSQRRRVRPRAGRAFSRQVRLRQVRCRPPRTSFPARGAGPTVVPLAAQRPPPGTDQAWRPHRSRWYVSISRASPGRHRNLGHSARWSPEDLRFPAPRTTSSRNSCGQGFWAAPSFRARLPATQITSLLSVQQTLSGHHPGTDRLVLADPGGSRPPFCRTTLLTDGEVLPHQFSGALCTVTRRGPPDTWFLRSDPGTSLIHTRPPARRAPHHRVGSEGHSEVAPTSPCALQLSSCPSEGSAPHT